MASGKDGDGGRRWFFPRRPVVCAINDCAAAAGGKAFINLLPIPLGFGDNAAALTLPAFFIGDGMSVPWLFEGIIEPEYGIAAGHVHDYLYSRAAADALDDLAQDACRGARELADEALRDYLRAHCGGGFSALERWAAWAAVRAGGKKAFRDGGADARRETIARRLMRDAEGALPGGGRGEQDDAAARRHLPAVLRDMAARRA